MKLYTYRYNKQYSHHAGLSEDQSTENLGVLGDEIKTLIPDAVTDGVSKYILYHTLNYDQY